jgi:hypothetical protein
MKPGDCICFAKEKIRKQSRVRGIAQDRLFLVVKKDTIRGAQKPRLGAFWLLFGSLGRLGTLLLIRQILLIALKSRKPYILIP